MCPTHERSTSKTETPITYRPDAPLTDSKLDFFDRAPFAYRIADTIGTRIDPSCLVVGIYGPWGDGKTTVLNFIKERLTTYPHVTVVSFNPWRLEGEQAVLQGFLSTLAEALDRDLGLFGDRRTNPHGSDLQDPMGFA